ncbi:hypothetical protein AX769_05420 [Frondihabitans sp. PAMC 28766]|uniref:hypothetical protein n=1 Tax=Frondihabitans sp. PAMC 28766 TaxID=1795630 RepID=UPI00078CE5E0|nr:hypothetical protein [Frondihabitans sp. PAMC 28766]AMM19685.1 hypothetical protein AX769_05420 [Frondihabitans sp. PAMC 28766]
MHVQLKLTLAAPPATVVDALANPEVMVAVTTPLLVYRSEEPTGFPRRWSTTPSRVSARILGLVSLGKTHVSLRFYDVKVPPVDSTPLGGIARVQEDTGRGIAGTFTLLQIRHRMAVSPAPRSSGLVGGTLLRDRMEFHAGWLTPLLWPGLWLVWQWRGFRFRQLAPTWPTPDSAPTQAPASASASGPRPRVLMRPPERAAVAPNQPTFRRLFRASGCSGNLTHLVRRH